MERSGQGRGRPREIVVLCAEEREETPTKTADQILDSITRYCTRINDSGH